MIGIVTGIISALTTSFPGGQLPNIIEKPVTAFLFLALVLLVKKSVKTAAAAVITIAKHLHLRFALSGAGPSDCRPAGRIHRLGARGRPSGGCAECDRHYHYASDCADDLKTVQYD